MDIFIEKKNYRIGCGRRCGLMTGFIGNKIVADARFVSCLIIGLWKCMMANID